MKILEIHKGKKCDDAEYGSYTHRRCGRCMAVKAVELFYRKNTGTARGWAWDTRCIECSRELCRDYGAASKERRNARLRGWRRQNPAGAVRLDRTKRIKRKYQLKPAQVDAMRAAQDGKCAICNEQPKQLVIDHCHVKGHVRALLCQTCNTFLGWYEKKADKLLRFQKYLDEHRG